MNRAERRRDHLRASAERRRIESLERPLAPGFKYSDYRPEPTCKWRVNAWYATKGATEEERLARMLELAVSRLIQERSTA